MAKTSIDKQIAIYKTKSKKINVRLEQDSIWLSQKQMGELFGKDADTIGHHIEGIYGTKELPKKSTTAYFAVVQIEKNRSVNRKIQHFNLDVVISVGYRVNSKQGTQFRIWANKILKEYLVKGYVVDTQKLKKQTEKIEALQKTILTLTHFAEKHALKASESTGLLQVIRDYTFALDLLDQYDHQTLRVPAVGGKDIFRITYEEAKTAIDKLSEVFAKEGYQQSTLFGHEKDDSFKGSLYNIYQTFDGVELYPSLEAKATHLLYYVIKNHSFSDGNKRIAAFLFVWFLERNNYLYLADGRKRIDDNALVAICLMIAESRPDEKDVIAKLVVNLLGGRG